MSKKFAVEKTKEEWKKELSPLSYSVLREQVQSRPSETSTTVTRVTECIVVQDARQSCLALRQSMSPVQAGLVSMSQLRPAVLART